MQERNPKQDTQDEHSQNLKKLKMLGKTKGQHVGQRLRKS
jgi:hypothetical protein